MAAKRRPAPLDPERILDAAIALADDAGLDALSMRRLGQALGVEAMSLYNHHANKDAILDGMVARVLAQVELPAEGGDWEEELRGCAVSLHEALRRHPWACSLVMAPASGPDALAARLRYIDALLRTLREAGFTPEQAYHALSRDRRPHGGLHDVGARTHLAVDRRRGRDGDAPDEER